MIKPGTIFIARPSRDNHVPFAKALQDGGIHCYDPSYSSSWIIPSRMVSEEHMDKHYIRCQPTKLERIIYGVPDGY